MAKKEAKLPLTSRLPSKKPSRPPLSSSSSATQTPKVHDLATYKTDLPHKTASPPPANSDVAKPPRPAVEQTVGQHATPRLSRNLWEPFERYWSSSNPLPDYGHASAGTPVKGPQVPCRNSGGGIMTDIVKKVGLLPPHAAVLEADEESQTGKLFIGNTLNGTSTRQIPPPTRAKRTSNTPFPKHTKRPRTNGDEIHDTVSIDGSSEQHDTPGSANSAAQGRKDKRDCQSLRSSGDRQGSEVNEFRATSKHAGIGRGRSRHRHKKDAGHVPDDHTGGGRGTASSQQKNPGSVFHKPRPLLSRQSEVLKDQISDSDDEDADVATVPPQPWQPMVNLRGAAQYTQAVFNVPDASGDDEPSQPQPKTKLRDAMGTSGTTRRGIHTASGTKRRATSPDDLQILQANKRRPESSGRGDIPRTNFESAPRTEGIVDSFSVKQAVCDPRFIYPTADGMFDGDTGATNEPCSLVMSTKGGPKLFKATDSQQAGELDELDWITPNLSKVSKIEGNLNSPIVRLYKSTDSMAKFATGATLFIRFGSPNEASTYTRLCIEANPGIKFNNLYGENLRPLMNGKLNAIRSSNMKKIKKLPPDMQLVERQETKGNRTRRANVEPDTPRDEHAKVKTVRAQMRAHDDDLGSSPATARPSSQVRTPRTPAEVRQLRNAVGSDDDDHDEEERGGRGSGKLWQSPSRTNRYEATSTSHRALRSTKPKTRTPSPGLERWTDKNPNWVDDRNYKIPLIYERTTISEVEIERLDEGQFLNDEVISFYAKYLHKQLEARDEQMAKKVYVFSSFFWEKLRAKGHDGVKSWTSKIDLLSFDYIVVPINQHTHWYLAIICNPRALLPQDDVDLEEDEPSATEHDGHVDARTANGIDAISTFVASETAPIPVGDQLDGPGIIDLDDTKNVTSSEKPKAKRGPAPRKYDPKAPRVITLDSLDGSHPSVATALKNYLSNEIKEKKGLDVAKPSFFGMTAKDIPFQTNFTDCGVYLLGYLEEFMNNPHVFTRRILQHEERNWDVNAPVLRNKIRDLIFGLQAEYQAEQMRERREKKRLAEERKAKSRTPTAEAQSSPRVAGEQSARRTPVIAPPGTKSCQQTPVRAQSSRIPSVNRDQESVKRVSHRSVSSPPLQRQQSSPELSPLKSSQSQEDGLDAFNASTIVNPSDSVEIKDEHTNDEAEATPRVMKSVEAVDQGQHVLSSPESSKPRDALRVLESKQPLPAGDFDHRKFLPLMGPSSSSSEAASKANSDPSPGRLSKTLPRTSKYDDTRSRFFPSSAKSSTKCPAGANGTPKFTGVNSDSEVDETRRRKGSTKQKQRPGRGHSRSTIDLTDD